MGLLIKDVRIGDARVVIGLNDTHVLVYLTYLHGFLVYCRNYFLNAMLNIACPWPTFSPSGSALVLDNFTLYYYVVTAKNLARFITLSINYSSEEEFAPPRKAARSIDMTPEAGTLTVGRVLLMTRTSMRPT